jgi:hypothetical protein
VIIRGVNDDELIDLIEFGKRIEAEVRFIEYMDVPGATHWSSTAVVSRQEMLATLEARYGPLDPIVENSSAPADRYILPDGTIFGIISSTTEPFCRTCDRSRLTADGLWYLCLYATRGIDLRGPLRAGASAEQLRALVDPLYRASAWLGALAGLFGVLFAAPLCALLYGAPFARSGDVFAWLVWMLPISLVGAHARYVLLAVGQQRAELVANAAGAAIAVAAGLALVPTFGTRGGAVAIVAGTLATSVAAHALAARAEISLPGIAPLVRPKTTLFPDGLRALEAVARGEIAFAVASISEIRAVEGVILAGPLTHLKSAEVLTQFRAGGIEPAD